MHSALQAFVHPHRTVVAHAEDIAAALAERRFHRGDVLLQLCSRHKCLDGARKAAALQPPGALPRQDMLAEGHAYGHPLLARVADAVSVLVVFKRGVPAVDDQRF